MAWLGTTTRTTCGSLRLTADMYSYPKVNWWRGNLRLHESKSSLIARFANLNGLKIAQSERYFRNMLGTGNNPTGAAIDQLAFALGDDLATVQTVIGETLNLAGQHDFRLLPERISNTIRYCEQCAVDGYHSYIHEYPWLAICPFHETPLKTIFAERGTGSIQVRRCKTLTKVMQDTCEHWPKSGAKEFVPENHDGFNWLLNWTLRVTKVAARFSQNKIWASDNVSFLSAEGYGHKLGQLHALEPIPDTWKSLFTELQEGWGAEISYLPIEAKQEIVRIKKKVDISLLFLLYKRIAAYSSQAYGFNRQADICREHFTERHKDCYCEWRRQTDGFHTFWIKVRPDGYKYWNKVCAYEVANEKFELAVGRRLDALSRRGRENERLALLRESEPLVDLGLVGYTPDAHVSPYGYSYAVPVIWPCLEWIGTPWLNATLDQMAKFEVQSTFECLTNWLDSLAAGEHPDSYAELCPPIRLSETEESLVLVRWRRHSI
jgi:hypothetical protein